MNGYERASYKRKGRFMTFETYNGVRVNIEEEHIICGAFPCVLVCSSGEELYMLDWPQEQIEYIDRVLALTAHITEDERLADVTEIRSLSLEEFLAKRDEETQLTSADLVQ